MQVILLERIGRLGQMGDVVNVKDGFARNFLLPQGKALRATEANRKRFERDKAQLEARDLELKSEAKAVVDQARRQELHHHPPSGRDAASSTARFRLATSPPPSPRAASPSSAAR